MPADPERVPHCCARPSIHPAIAGFLLDRAEIATARDAVRGAHNSRVAASHGSVPAMTNLGLMIVAGEGAEAGITMLETAAERGDDPAIDALMALNGLGQALDGLADWQTRRPCPRRRGRRR